ncbi:MAG TPA: glutathione S-transferase family protein [Beijerinckiaceae bacterium]|jgi:glutathione S-transferase|nr:glutathione S-transferase family protein [Beijerinckiaceae bacterium]
MPLKLILANKAYSSWSLRPWILMTHFKIPFEETVVPLDQPDTREKLLAYSPTGKAPTLIDGDTAIWESLAILEYLAEKYPKRPIWPETRPARALARALSAEMHAGFQPIRAHMPTNFRRSVQARALTEEAARDVSRIETAWASTRKRFGRGGPFLFGAFCAADAMFAPVVNRLYVYAVPVAPQTRAYMDAIMALPAWRRWITEAAAEPWRIERYENI